MLLREHPLMSYRGNRSWPPTWMRINGGDEATQPVGEVGILKRVTRSVIEPYDRCFLIIEYRGAEYLGALLLSDPAFCREIYRMLIQSCGKTIQEIGDIDLSHTF
jgi:hypothetical protein